MPELNEDAKREIAEAIKIVKEDKILKFMSGFKSTPPTPSGNDPANPPAPPPGAPGNDPTNPPKPKRRGGVLWADQVIDE